MPLSWKTNRFRRNASLYPPSTSLYLPYSPTKYYNHHKMSGHHLPKHEKVSQPPCITYTTWYFCHVKPCQFLFFFISTKMRRPSFGCSFVGRSRWADWRAPSGDEIPSRNVFYFWRESEVRASKFRITSNIWRTFCKVRKEGGEGR